jgi:hypothetical protein
MKWDEVTSLSDVFVAPELEHKLVAGLCILLYVKPFFLEPSLKP